MSFPCEFVAAVESSIADPSSIGKDSCHIVFVASNGIVNTRVDPSSHCLCPSQACAGEGVAAEPDDDSKELDSGEIPKMTIKPRYFSRMGSSIAVLEPSLPGFVG